MTLVRVDANLPWGVLHGKGGAWIGICDPLKLTVQAPTYAELLEDISHTLDAMLKDLLASNELPKFLHEQGWQIAGPLPTHRRAVRFDVPFFPALIKLHGPQATVHQ
jgi:predicted RNase H-like HicB family nuclease